MKCFYLDHNIYIEALRDSSICETVLSLKTQGILFFYSPAHVEEIYKALNEKGQGYLETADCLLRMLSEFTDERELLPSQDKGIVKWRESPYKCYKRVSDLDTMQRMAHDSVVKYSSDKKNYQEMIVEDRHNQNISNIPINQIWKHPTFATAIDDLNKNMRIIVNRQNNNIDTAICALLGADKRLPDQLGITENSYSELKVEHTQLEFVMEILFRILNRYGYNSDKSANTTLSGIHDVSHAIYATATDTLFTTDQRFAKRCAAVYYYLGVPTQVVTCKERNIVEELSAYAV